MSNKTLLLDRKIWVQAPPYGLRQRLGFDNRAAFLNPSARAPAWGRGFRVQTNTTKS